MNRKSNPAAETPAAAPEGEPAFEQLLEELEAIVARMEEGDLPLEQTLKEFERGQSLAAACETRLRDATQRVQKLLDDDAGTDGDGAS
ncbi:exodeoxyribonuclease VII small subunit [Algiphilus sp.]|uniref:exodeoxyribonuclease VII small subunit n=1 Tax=Algiphilus sp. TaxID=1872431 RepID=UPI003C4C8A49